MGFHFNISGQFIAISFHKMVKLKIMTYSSIHKFDFMLERRVVKTSNVFSALDAV
jgi:hypothetical protein